ncbi:MAG: hypothetical protein WBB82_15845 [Limnothrix sp.]
MDCIKLDYEQLSETQNVCHGVSFVLDQNDLLKLLAAKAKGYRPNLSADFLSGWRHYVLFNGNNDLQNAWSFTLHYEGQGIFKTVISLDGDVLHQVCADILPHDSLFQQLSEVHYWLIQQLVGLLRWRRYRGDWIHPIALGGAIALSICFVLIYFRTLLAQPFLFLLVPLILAFLYWILRLVLRFAAPYLRKFLLKQILSGYFSRNYEARRAGLDYLAKF